MLRYCSFTISTGVLNYSTTTQINVIKFKMLEFSCNKLKLLLLKLIMYMELLYSENNSITRGKLAPWLRSRVSDLLYYQ